MPIREISDEMKIPFQYLTKLLQRLQTGGLIDSRRGNTGGVSLARSSNKITLMDVLAVLEPDIIGKKCLLHDGQNSDNHCCEFGIYWHEVQTKINDLLSTTSIQWVADQNSEITPAQDPQRGYGYSEETKPLLSTSYGFMPWDDSHQPEMSLTDAQPDGRWMFINANNTPRVVRIDLQSFTTREILELPNTGGNHASTFATENNEYLIGGTRFSIPTELDLDVPIHTYSDNFNGLLSFIAVDEETGRMEMDFQI